MYDHPSGNVRFVISTSNAVDDDEDEENADTRRGKRQRKDLVGDGGVEGRAGGAVGGGEGFKRRMTSVGRSVGGAAKRDQGEIAPRSWWRSILRHHASTSPSPISRVALRESKT